MKSHPLLPILTAVLGFAAAWIAKPSNPPPATSVTEAPAPTKRVESTATAPLETKTSPKRPEPPKAGEYPLADRAAQGPQTREEAKMARLVEELGLSFDQQNSMIKLIQDVQATASMDTPVLADLTTRGKAVEDGLKSLLNPEQFAKFQEMRARERENRIELRAHQLLDRAIEEIDFSGEQREAALDRLRQQSKEDLQSIPAAAALFLEKSILPTSGKELPIEGVLALAKAGEPVGGSDPEVVHQRIVDSQRTELERMLSNFDGILTPGQMGQYQAAIAEQRALMEKFALKQQEDAEKRMQSTPPAPEIEIGPAPGDGGDQ